MQFVKKTLLTFILISCSLAYSTAQSQNDLKRLFYTASNHLIYHEYQQALEIYKKLIAYEPQNANYNFLAGYCGNHMAGMEDEVLPFFRLAAKKVSIRYRENSFKEDHAPIEAYFHLAKACQLNRELDSAIHYFETYKTFLSRREEEEMEMVDHHIQTCQHAKTILRDSSGIVLKQMEDFPGKPEDMLFPVVSGNDKAMVYYSGSGDRLKIMYSVKENGRWMQAENIFSQLSGGDPVYPVSFSYDGSSLYLFHEEKGSGDIYVSRRQDGKWTQIEPLNPHINSRYRESHASVSPSGSTLYFTSDRKGGLGGLDIYRSQRQPDGSWGPAENLGNNINTRFDEETPFMAHDNQSLYFSSEGHTSMGGFDVFKSMYHAGWSKPENLGIPVNSTHDDLFFIPLEGNTLAFYSGHGITGSQHKALSYVYHEKDMPSGSKIPVSSTANRPTLASTKPFRAGSYADSNSSAISAPLTTGHRLTPNTQAMASQKTSGSEADLSSAPVNSTVKQNPKSRQPSQATISPVTANHKPGNPAETTVAPVTKNPEPLQPYDASVSTNKYTVQILALQNPVNTFQVDKKTIKVAHGDDNIHRYTVGEYEEFQAVLQKWQSLVEAGYADAFITRTASIQNY